MPVNFILLTFTIAYLLQATLQLIPTVNYTFPTVYFDTNSSIITSQVSAGIKEFKVTDNYIARLSTVGNLDIWSADNQSLLYSLFYGTSINGSLIC